MQPITDAIHSILTAPNVEVSAGAELLDENDELVEDISDFLGVGGQVTRANYDQIHGKCDIALSRTLDWSNARVRLFQTVSAGDRITSTEVVDRPAQIASVTDNTDAEWATGTLTDLRTSSNALQLDLV